MFWLPPQEIAKLNVLEEQDLTSEVFALCHRKKLVRVAWLLTRCCVQPSQPSQRLQGRSSRHSEFPAIGQSDPSRTVRAECLLETHQDSMPGAPQQPLSDFPGTPPLARLCPPN